MYEKYLHHGVEVVVKRELKGKHRNHCLCHSCALFHPEKPENCEIAQAVFSNCIQFNLVTPVWECPKFEEKPVA